MSLMRRNQTDGVTPPLPGPEPPELGAPPGPPSDPLHFGDDFSAPSEEQTFIICFIPSQFCSYSTEAPTLKT